jgi:hypothetical protein
LCAMCRRQQTDEVREVLEALRDRDPDIPLHGFGVKSLGLRRYGDLLTSADRLAWSYNARRNPGYPGARTRGARTACSGGADMTTRKGRAGQEVTNAVAAPAAGDLVSPASGLPKCILPGCPNTVAEQGLPCDDCAAAFGSHLRATGGPR